MPDPTHDLDGLLGILLGLPGDKALTLIDARREPLVIEVSADGTIGHAPDDPPRLRARLASALAGGGALIIRRALPVEAEVTRDDDPQAPRPRKEITGVRLINGRWIGLPAEAVRLACCTDADTGRALATDPSVRFVAFPPEPEG